VPTLWPPFAPSDANWERTEFRMYLGGAPNFVANAALAQGDALTTTAEATTTLEHSPGETSLYVSDTTAFLTRSGALNVVAGDGTEHWFTYRDTIDTAFLWVQRIGGPEQPIAAGATVRQWRDITNETFTIRRSASLEGPAIIHASEIDGIDWNSLLHRQYATLYYEARYWNSVFQQWTSWIPRGRMYLNPVKPTAFPGFTTWKATAGAEAKILGITPTVPQQIGQIVIPYTATADEHLTNPDLEPFEGNGVADFSTDRLNDGDRATPYISRDAPTTLPVKPWYPGAGLPGSGPIQVPMGNIPGDASGYGLRIQTVFVGSEGPNQQGDHYIEIVNMGPDPTGWPFEDDVQSTLDQTPGSPNYGNYVQNPIAATEDASTWGARNIGTLALETDGCRIYLGSKNGGDEPIMLARNATAILCRDRARFEAQNTVPEGTVIVDWQSCDGYMPGLDPARLHRGIGGNFAIKRQAGWVALRESSRGGVRFVTRTAPGSPETTVASGGDTISTNGELACSSSIADFPDSGHLVPQGLDEVRIYYTGKSGNTFTGCKKVNPDRQNTLPTGTGIKAGVLADKWTDFVAWGAVTVPTVFWGQQPDGTPFDQNTTSIEARRVWGYRGSDGYSTGFTTVGTVNVSPNGIPAGYAIRRKNAFGGGVYQGNRYGGDDGNDVIGTFIQHDGGTAMDWEEVQGRPVGNRGGDDTSIVIRLAFNEFTAAIVDTDDTATVGDNGEYLGILRVGAGQAARYPAALVPGERIRTTQGVDFLYQSHDDSNFYGVIKYDYSGGVSKFWAPGAGPTIPNGSTLTWVHDTNPKHLRDKGRAKRLEARNSYQCVGLDFRRFQPVPAVMVAQDNGTSIILAPSDTLLPTSGTLYATPGYTGSPIATPESIGQVLYTGISGNSLTGVTRTFSTTLPPGTTLSLRVSPSYVSDCLILASRRPNPNDPVTFLGDNPDWDIVHDGALSADRTYIGLSAHGGGPVSEVAIVVRQMSDSGRAKINEIVPYATPEPTSDGGAAARRERERRTLDAGYVADKILELAGYPASRRRCYGGPEVRGASISSGTWWEALTDWAERTGMLVSDGPLGVVTVKPDPRVWGLPVTREAMIRIRTDSVWGQLEAEEREQFNVSQVTLDAINDKALERYLVTYPARPTRFGAPAAPVRNRRAPSLKAAQAWARSIFARLNGGWRLTVPMGQMDTIDPGDVVRLELPVDEAGVLFDGIDVFVTGTEYSYRSGVQTGRLTVERYKVA